MQKLNYFKKWTLDEILINFTHLSVISKSLKVHSKAMKNLNTVSKPLINKILQVTAVTQVQFHNHDKYHSNPHCQHKNK